MGQPRQVFLEKVIKTCNLQETILKIYLKILQISYWYKRRNNRLAITDVDIL